MTLSLAAVFIPVLFMGGILGRLFREFAVTICAAILISGVVSITLTPMLCSRFLQAYDREKQPGRFNRAAEALLQRHAARLRREPALGAAAPSGDAGRVLRRAGRHRLSLRAKSPRDSSPTRTTTQMDVITGSRAGHLVLQDGGVPEAGVGCDRRTIPTSNPSCPASEAATEPHPTRAACGCS